MDFAHFQYSASFSVPSIALHETVGSTTSDAALLISTPATLTIIYILPEVQTSKECNDSGLFEHAQHGYAIRLLVVVSTVGTLTPFVSII